MLSRVLLLVGGLILLLQTQFGAFAILMFGFDSLQEVATALSLTLAFPIFLVGLKSFRLSLFALWIFFIAQWVNECFLRDLPQLVSPFDWWHGDTLFVAVSLLQVGYLMLPRIVDGGGSVNLLKAFSYGT